jgi:prepilin-type N-terminal cleavage/methylation domain-containing protein
VTFARRPQAGDSSTGFAGSAGFTLLEVMAAVAILGLTLVVLLSIVTNNVRATAHSRMITSATFLARGKMVSIEDKVIEKGFQDLDEEDEGTFEEQGFPEYRWTSDVEKIELPTEALKDSQNKSIDNAPKVGESGKSADPMSALTGMVGGLMGVFFEPIRVGLQESIRRVTLTVYWREHGRPAEQSVEVTMYVTDPARLDLAMSLGVGGPGTPGAPGTPGTPGTPGATTSGSASQNRSATPGLTR